MKTCTYCGRENSDDAIQRSGCGGRDFVVSATAAPVTRPSVNLTSARAKGLLVWRAPSVVLIIVATGYSVFAILNLWLGHIQTLRGDARTGSILYTGAAWNTAVAVLCFFGRSLMKRHAKLLLIAGALAIAGALLITLRTWILAFPFGLNPVPWIEPLLVWPPLVYAIIYAYKESRLMRGAEGQGLEVSDSN